MKSHYIVNKLICLNGFGGENYMVRKLQYFEGELLEGYSVPGSVCKVSRRLMYCCSRFKRCGYFTEKKGFNREVVL